MDTTKLQQLFSLGSLAALTTVLPSCNRTKAPETNIRPNVVILFADDLGVNDLGYQNPMYQTPNINQLKQDGMLLTDCRITCPTSSPSRATLLTGLHPVDLEIVRHIPSYDTTKGFDWQGHAFREYNYWAGDPAQMPSRNWLKPEAVTYAEALKKAGYFNMFIGKWHLGDSAYHPVKQGFDDEFCVTPWGAPARYYPPYFERGDSIVMDTTKQYITDYLTDKAVDFIANYDKKQPFMLSFYYYAVHHPHHGRVDWLKYYRDKGLNEQLANYAAMVSALDESVGRVRKALADKGLAENTLIIFLSDQGGYFPNTPFSGGKMGGKTLNEGGSRVPFIACWPGKIAAGVQVDVPVTSSDVFPTLVELSGGNPSDYKGLDGLSLLPMLTGKATVGERPIYSYRSYEDQYVSLKTGKWKYIGYRSGKQELFDLSQDIAEANNLAEKMPEKTREMADMVQVWEKEKGIALKPGEQFQKK